jgi:hypothetical protein
VADEPRPAAGDAALSRIAARSEEALREALAASTVIARYGTDAWLEWLEACADLVAHDPEGGRAFIGGSVAAATAADEVQSWTAQARRFSRWRGSTPALRGFVQNLPAAFGVLGHAGQARWAAIGLIWCRRHLASGTAYFTTSLRELTARQGITGLETLAHTAEELLERCNLALATYLRGALRVRNLFGDAATLPWALRGCEVLQSDRVRGEAYFRLESEESLGQLLDSHAGFRVRDRERLIGMLLHAWLDTEVRLAASAWSPEWGRPFVEVDSASLYLPIMLPSREEALLGSLHAAGHLRFGTFAPEVLGQLAGADPSAPPGDILAAALAPWQDDLTRFLICLDICEDLRVDARLAATVPRYLPRLLRLADTAPAAVGPSAAYRAFAVQTLRVVRGHGDHGLTRDTATHLARLLDPAATFADAFVCARWLHDNGTLPGIAAEEAVEAYLPGRGPNLSRMLPRREGGEGAGESGETAQPAAPDERSPAAAGSVPEASQSLRHDPAAAAAGAPGRAGEPRGRRGLRRMSPAASNPRGRAYPEWDYRAARYKRDWAWVQERALAERNAGEAARITARHRRTLQQLKRAMQAQKPTRLAPRRRQLEGEDLDLDAAVCYVVERCGGWLSEATVYRRRVPAQRDVAVILLADLSTSIMQLVPRGGGRLVDRVRAGILLFAESLDVVGDSYAIGGFCSKYRENVTWYPIKQFDEGLTARVRETVGGLAGRLATRMGAAIRHAVTQFEGVESRRRLLLILSDGRPEDYDDGGDRRYLQEDTRMAVKEAVAAGVHPFCVTVDRLGQQYLPQIFGKGHYLVLDRIDRLPAKLPEIYLRLRQ